MGLNGGVGKMGAHLQIPIFEKESEEKGKREDFEEAEKRAPSLLNLAPTKSDDRPVLKSIDFHLKEGMTLQFT